MRTAAMTRGALRLLHSDDELIFLDLTVSIDSHTVCVHLSSVYENHFYFIFYRITFLTSRILLLKKTQ